MAHRLGVVIEPVRLLAVYYLYIPEYVDRREGKWLPLLDLLDPAASLIQSTLEYYATVMVTPRTAFALP